MSKRVRGVPLTVVLLIAAWILAICVWLGCRQFFPERREGTYDPRIPSDFDAIRSALEMYRQTIGDLPTQAQGLEALIERPADLPPDKNWIKWMERVPVDPWNHSYGYVRDASLPGGYGLCSRGKDGIDGTSDDIVTWTDKK